VAAIDFSVIIGAIITSRASILVHPSEGGNELLERRSGEHQMRGGQNSLDVERSGVRYGDALQIATDTLQTPTNGVRLSLPVHDEHACTALGSLRRTKEKRRERSCLLDRERLRREQRHRIVRKTIAQRRAHSQAALFLIERHFVRARL